MKNLTLLLVLISFASCTKSPFEGTGTENPGQALDRQIMLSHLSDQIIMPSYDSALSQFTLLESKIANFKSNANIESLTQAQDAFIKAWLTWQSIELFDIGPANQYVLRQYCNIYPASVEGIESNINQENPNLNLATSYTRQGFPAIDYLLFGTGNTQQEIIDWYQNPEQGAARLNYLETLCKTIVQRTQQVSNVWSSSYRNEFTQSTGLENGSSTNILVNNLILHYERFIRSGKIGIPAGIMQNGIIAPAKVEGLYSRVYSKALLTKAHQAFITLFTAGSDSVQSQPSLYTYCKGLNPALASDILNQLQVCQLAIDQLPDNFYDNLGSQAQQFESLYSEMQKTIKLLKVDMSSAMSTTITYADNDGD